MTTRTGASIFYNARLAQRKAAKDETAQFEVRSVTKAGKISKAHVTDVNKVATREAAEARKAEMERLNPGSKFAITDRAGNVVA